MSLQQNTSQNVLTLYKNPAIGLMFCVFLGPIGLLYASFWGGFFMIFLGVLIVHYAYFFPILLFWISCCIWGMGAIEVHNKKMLSLLSDNKQE